MDKKFIFSQFLKLLLASLATLILVSCSSLSLPRLETVPSRPTNSQSLWEGSSTTIWQKLQQQSPTHLAQMKTATADINKKAWLDLALISKRYSTQPQTLAQACLTWQNQYPSHPAKQLLPSQQTLSQIANSSPPQHLALLLPLQGNYASAGQMVREGFLNAYYAQSSQFGKQNISFYDTATKSNTRSLYQQALNNGADIILGPLTKDHVQQLSSSGSFPTPVIALNYTTLRFGSLPTNFFEFGLLPEDEVIQIANRASEDGLSRALMIAPQTSWGQRLTAIFTTRWKANGGRIQDTYYYPVNADFNQSIASLLRINPETDKKLAQEGQSKDVLEQQRRHDFDVIFLFTQPREARIIVPLLRYYYVANVPIFATSAVYSGNPNQLKDVDLNGVTICDTPWSMHAAKQPLNTIQTDRLYAVGKDAYLLSLNLNRLIALPHFPLYGATGALTLSSNHQIHRRLPCRTFKHGLIQ